MKNHETIIVEKSGRVAVVTINRPDKLNALSSKVHAEGVEVFDELKTDSEVRVVVVKGAGEKAFVAGADISQFKEKRSSPEAVELYNKTADLAGQTLQTSPKPTIAMVRGFCIGGGTALAVGCDIRIASDDARFGVPAAKLGLGYRFTGIKRLADVVGPAFTAEIFFTARQFTAQEALQMNLVNRIVPAAELEKYTLDYANTIANNAPLTIASVKRSIIEYLRNPAERDMALCQKLVDDCYASADYKEGQTAFMEKRKPAFAGR